MKKRKRPSPRPAPYRILASLLLGFVIVSSLIGRAQGAESFGISASFERAQEEMRRMHKFCIESGGCTILSKHDAARLEGNIEALHARIATLERSAASCDGPSRSWLVLNARSYHADRSKDYNEANRGAGLEWGTDTLRAVGGVYRNSLDGRSRYVGAAWTPLALGAAQVGFVLGAVDGYEHANDGRAVPMVAGLVRLELHGYGVNVLVAPPFRESSAVLGLQFKKRFD